MFNNLISYFMKKLKISFGIAAIALMGIALSPEPAEADFCKSTGHEHRGGAFHCDGIGDIVCYYPCGGAGYQ